MADETTEQNQDHEWIGERYSRKEDQRLITGHGHFVDDQKEVNTAYLGLVRSPYAHARIRDIDVSDAKQHPGVLEVLTGDDIVDMMNPFLQIGPEPGSRIQDFPMAVDKVRYQGEPVAAVVTTSRMASADAAELVQVNYEVLDPVVDSIDALNDEAVVHDETAGTNQIYHNEFDWGDVEGAFDEAAYVIEIDHLKMNRFTAAPLENNACLAEWEPYGDLYFETNNNFPAIAMQQLAPSLGISMDKIHCKTEDIGGSFGVKINNYPYMALAALASRETGGRPIKWIETRSDHLSSAGQSNERTYTDTRVALDEDGVITGIESTHIDDIGAYPRYEPLGAIIWAQVVPGAYRFDNIRIDFHQVTSNKCPTSPVRGYSRLQHLFFLERVIDICSYELDIPADEIRQRNYIQPEEFPYTTPNKCIYDSGNYPLMLEKGKELINWDKWQKKIEEAREEGRMIGIGIGSTLDSGTNNFTQSQIINPHNPFSGNSEAATVWLDMDGSVVVAMGTSPQGQGQETTAAQCVAEDLNIHPDMIDVRTGFDSDRNTHTGHSGTYASQFAVTGLSAVHGAAENLGDEIRRLGAFALEVDQRDVEIRVGDQGPEVGVRGTDQSVPFWQLANMVYVNNANIPDELDDVTLNCRFVYKPEFGDVDLEEQTGNLTLTYAAQLHIAVIEIDPDTYNPQILDYACVDDCGNVVNPTIVEGQVHGATAHGIGGSLLETCAYDEGGNLLTGTFSDFVPITAMNMPDLKYEDIQTPSPFSFHGAKGMGEGGGAPFHTIAAALQDALYDKGVLINESFNSPSRLHQALNQKDMMQWEDHVDLVRSPS